MNINHAYISFLHALAHLSATEAILADFRTEADFRKIVASTC